MWKADGTGVPRVLRHEGPVVDLDVSPDGAHVITVSMSQMRVWTLAEPVSSRLLAVVGEAWPVAWSPPDGRRIVVTRFGDASARVVSTEGPSEPVSLLAHEPEDWIRAAAWSPDGAHVLLVCIHGVASVWTPEGVREASVSTGIEQPNAAAWSPDGRRVVIASEARSESAEEAGVGAKVGAWEFAAERGSRNLRPAELRVDEDFNFWGERDTRGRTLMRFTGGAMVWSDADVLLFVLGERSLRSPDGRHELLARGRGSTVRVMSTQKQEPLRLKRARNGAWSPDGRRMLGWSMPAAWVWTPGEEPIELQGAAGSSELTWSPDGARIVGSSSAGVQIWASDGARGPLRSISPELRGGCPRGAHEDEAELADPLFAALFRKEETRATWSPEGARVAFSARTMGPCGLLWATEGTAEPVVLRSAEDLVPATSPLAWSSDGTRILTSSETTTRVWSSDGTGAPLVVPGHSAAWSPDGRRFVVTQPDGSARVWAAEGTGEPVVLAEEQAPIESTQWSPDGKHILVRSQAPGAEPALRLWSPEGGAGRLVPQGEGARAVWSPEGGRLFVWYDDRRAPRVWSVDGAAEPLVLASNEGEITAATWSADGRRVVTSEGPSNIQVWSADGTAPPIYIEAEGTPELSRDGARLRVDASVWRLTVPELREVLMRANRDCLSPANRVAYLGEMSFDALARYEACEREHGREPFFTSTVSDESASDDPRGGRPRGRPRGGDAEADPSEE